jgi:hypothetical protein
VFFRNISCSSLFFSLHSLVLGGVTLPKVSLFATEFVFEIFFFVFFVHLAGQIVPHFPFSHYFLFFAALLLALFFRIPVLVVFEDVLLLVLNLVLLVLDDGVGHHLHECLGLVISASKLCVTLLLLLLYEASILLLGLNVLHALPLGFLQLLLLVDFIFEEHLLEVLLLLLLLLIEHVLLVGQFLFDLSDKHVVQFFFSFLLMLAAQIVFVQLAVATLLFLHYFSFVVLLLFLLPTVVLAHLALLHLVVLLFLFFFLVFVEVLLVELAF